MTTSYLHDFFRYVSVDYDDNGKIVDPAQISENTWHYQKEKQTFGATDCVYAAKLAEELWYTKDAEIFYLQSELADPVPSSGVSGWFTRYVGGKGNEAIAKAIDNGKLLTIETLADLAKTGDFAILFSGDMNAKDAHIAFLFREFNEKILEHEYAVYDSSGYRTERDGMDIDAANKTKYFRRKVFTEKLLPQYPFAVKPTHFIDDYETPYQFIF